MVLSIASLHDVFGFGEKRIQRWAEKFNEGAEYLAEGLATWQDYIDGIKEELGIEIEFK